MDSSDSIWHVVDAHGESTPVRVTHDGESTYDAAAWGGVLSAEGSAEAALLHLCFRAGIRVRHLVPPGEKNPAETDAQLREQIDILRMTLDNHRCEVTEEVLRGPGSVGG